MRKAIALRDDYDAARVRTLARRSRHAAQSRRLLALAAIYDGATRGEAARLAGTDRQIVRDWVLRFNAQGPDGLIARHGGGAARRITPSVMEALAQRIEEGPIPAAHGVVRWRLRDLCAWLHEDYGISLSVSWSSRIVRNENFRLLTARPRHYAQNPDAQGIFKKTSLTSLLPSEHVIPEKISNCGGRTKR